MLSNIDSIFYNVHNEHHPRKYTVFTRDGYILWYSRLMQMNQIYWKQIKILIHKLSIYLYRELVVVSNRIEKRICSNQSKTLTKIPAYPVNESILWSAFSASCFSVWDFVDKLWQAIKYIFRHWCWLLTIIVFIYIVN